MRTNIVNVFHPFRFLSKLEIESHALNVLRQMQAKPNYAPKWPLDSSRVAEFLGLDLVWDYIPDDSQGQIAARILPLEKLIEINENIPQLRGGFGESTIAHEIGHWVLHINQQEVARKIRLQNKGINVRVEPLLCRTVDDINGIEWQAQYFAGCLLMPQHILIELSKDKDLTKWQHLYQMKDELGITISNLLHRLQDLGWIYLEPNSRKIYLGKS
ncbi:MAG: ImmA/IrrE family metallo-endopeptidase [Xenococcaceae cyanobacterium MO_167.B52]|nr:ImmA/IrrE family metallo-endopeptidase [Xenococcaceae cyanobacterium MO_167.B52]